jgi:hypothetical protein
MKINITKTQRARLVKDWLNDMFSDTEIIDSYYVKNGKKIAFREKENKEFWFDYDLIWSFLESMFSLKYKELQAITEDWVDETLNFRGYTTMFYEEDGEKERWMTH